MATKKTVPAGTQLIEETFVSEHAKKMVTIIVEATPHEWPKDEITYAEVVTLEDPAFPQHPDRVYSVTYARANGNKSGVLSPSGSVKVKEGMEFYVKDTGES